LQVAQIYLLYTSWVIYYLSSPPPRSLLCPLLSSPLLLNYSLLLSSSSTLFYSVQKVDRKIPLVGRYAHFKVPLEQAHAAVMDWVAQRWFAPHEFASKVSEMV
tara:strand:- start:150 stop:458 length:309 start_codon:yes stop_codon:yes gene_type:complete